MPGAEDAADEGPMTTSDYLRLFVAAASGTAGLLLLVCGAAESALGIALLALAAFTLFHFVVEDRFLKARNPAYVASEEGGMRELATTFVATAGVVLGLLTVFAERSGTITTTVKVGTAALAATILLGIVLLGLLLVGAEPGQAATETQAEVPTDQHGLNFIRIVFNMVLWAFSLGLLCIAAALLYT